MAAPRDNLAKFFDEYTLTGEKLGGDLNGAIYGCVDRRNKKFVVKVIIAIRKMYEEGLLIQRALSDYCPNVTPIRALYYLTTKTAGIDAFSAHVKVFASYPKDDVILAVLPRASEGDLGDVSLARPLGLRTIKDSVRIFAQVAEAVNAIHTRGFVHCDIKVQNVLVHRTKQGRLQASLNDFDFACKIGEPVYIGRNSHSGPEFLQAERTYHRLSASPWQDVWAMGIMLYIIFTGNLPIEFYPHDDTNREAAWRKMTYSAEFVYPEVLTADQTSLLKMMLTRDWFERPTMAAVLQHPLILECTRKPLPPPSRLAVLTQYYDEADELMQE
jgi:serine/threonine protein kinase